MHRALRARAPGRRRLARQGHTVCGRHTMPFRGIWNDPRNLQGSLGEILLMHPVRPRRRSRRDQPNDRTSHGVQSSRSPRCERYLLCYLLSSRPSAVRNVCRTACMPLPPSPRGKRGIGGCRCCRRNTATTSKRRRRDRELSGPSLARPHTRHGRRFIHNTRQATRTRFPLFATNRIASHSLRLTYS